MLMLFLILMKELWEPIEVPPSKILAEVKIEVKPDFDSYFRRWDGPFAKRDMLKIYTPVFQIEDPTGLFFEPIKVNPLEHGVKLPPMLVASSPDFALAVCKALKGKSGKFLVILSTGFDDILEFWRRRVGVVDDPEDINFCGGWYLTPREIRMLGVDALPSAICQRGHKLEVFSSPASDSIARFLERCF